MARLAPRGLLGSLAYRARLALAMLRRFGRLVIFGFELIVLYRLFERPSLKTATASLLHAKAIDLLPPEITVTRAGDPHEPWTHGFNAVNAALFLNLRNPDQVSRTRYALPAPSFRAIYLWDSAFIAQIWKWWDADTAWETLRSVIEARDGDRLQHYHSEFGRSKLTQPPLLAWSLHALGQTVDEPRYRAWLRRAYAPLKSYHEWLYAHRTLPSGLFAWAHAYESGVENAPRFSTRDERRIDDTRRLAAPDFGAYMVLQGQALAAMARRLGLDGEARSFEARAEALAQAMNALLWSEQAGCYFDRDEQSGEFVTTRTVASLLPLWSGVPDARRAARMRDLILDPDAFNTLIPLPSVALDDPSFERDMWRGPVWVNTAYAVLEGLRRYGYCREASELAFRLCDGVYNVFAHTGRFFEFYDPSSHAVSSLRRKRGNRWKRLSLGSRPVADFVGWTGLVNTILLEMLLGLRRGSDGYRIAPRFPEAAAGFAISLSLPRIEAELDLDVLPVGAVKGQVHTPQGTKRFHAHYGEEVVLSVDQAP